MSLDKPGDLHQQLLVSEREIDIVVRTCVQALNAGIDRGSHAADQENGNESRPEVVFQTPAEFEAAKHGHHDVADY